MILNCFQWDRDNRKLKMKLKEVYIAVTCYIYFFITISKINTEEKLWSHNKITTLIHQNILCIKNKYTVIIFLAV